MRMNAEEVLEHYAKGKHDFQRIDLRDLVFNGADLCGANFTGADLENVSFDKSKLRNTSFSNANFRSQMIKIVARQVFIIALGIFVGMIVAVGGMWSGNPFSSKRNSNGIELREIVIGSTLWVTLGLSYYLFLRRGATSIALAIAGIGSVIVVVAGYANDDFAFTATATFSVAFAGIGAAIGVSNIASVILIELFAVVSLLDVIMKSNGNNMFDNVFSAVITMVVVGVHLLVTIVVRRRALRGDPRYAWVRDLAVTLRGLGGTRITATDLSGADFSGTNMGGVDLRGSLLMGTRFLGTQQLEWARFERGDLRRLEVQRLLMSGCGASQRFERLNLRGAYLAGADLTKAKLANADLSEAILSKADLQGADLTASDLRGTDLGDARLGGAELKNARVDALTYQRSRWTPDLLAELQERGVEIVALEAFPQAAQDRLIGELEGLTLTFSTKLVPFDRLLLDITIHSVLGRDTDCRVVEYKEQNHTALVRLLASRRRDLERVAEAIYQRIWEQQQAALISLSEVLNSQTLRGGLTSLHERLQKMELRVPVVSAQEQDRPRRQPTEVAWIWDLSQQDHLALPSATKVFISYAHEDDALYAELEKHLATLKRQGALSTWATHKIAAGVPWQEEQRRYLENADVVLLLLSADFLASDYLVDKEMRKALIRHDEDTCTVVPVIVRSCEWRQSPLGELAALPDDDRVVTQWENRDAAWLNVVSGLRRMLMGRAGVILHPRTP